MVPVRRPTLLLTAQGTKVDNILSHNRWFFFFDISMSRDVILGILKTQNKELLQRSKTAKTLLAFTSRTILSYTFKRKEKRSVVSEITNE